MHNIYLFQPQYTVKYGENTNYWLPYSVGCLWSYASQFSDITENFKLGRLFFSRESPESVLSKLDNPKICGFSSYIWNEQYNLQIAKQIKEKYPDCKIIFGGPNTNAQILEKHNFIDSIVLTEGEESFVKILRQYLQDGSINRIYNSARIKDLDIPSPYLSGVFDDIIAENPNVAWQMTLETSRGCPYACTFCDWGGLTYSKVFQFKLERVYAEINWAATHNVTYLFFADANFGIFKERDLEIAKHLSSVLPDSKIQGISADYVKNSNDIIFEIAKLLGNYGRGITVSVQSMNDDTLKDIKRTNMEINRIKHIMKISEEQDIPTYTEMILGLPNETLTSFKNGLCDLLESGQHNHIDIWFAQILINSELAQKSQREKYEIKTIEALDYVSLYNSSDSDLYPEVVELVNSTSTMTTEEMIEAYMYGWMIIQFHTAGYTQLYAKYMRHIEDFSYIEFYDLLFSMIKSEPILQEHYELVKSIVGTYLKTGKILYPDKVKGHAIHSMSWKFMYENKDVIYKLGKKLVEEYSWDSTDIYTLQKHYIYDKKVIYPEKIREAWINIKDWSLVQTNYRIVSRIDDTKPFDFYSFRRTGALKNKLIIY